MKDHREEWRFMRMRAEQLYEEGETAKALRMMRLINREQEKWFQRISEEDTQKKIVSTR